MQTCKTEIEYIHNSYDDGARPRIYRREEIACICYIIDSDAINFSKPSSEVVS